ncbi:hypothetical protein EC9_36940 [Rosistilla ulvae]|uniref:Cna protein B-type domain protein n=1 Tax=Rosistilla ulvae TaxID=1930277 RepID=A0A517M3R1_9BACT|nr:hypothetical protein [Rosistilla ulvae]QDS89494.1 hypothetical protein EC9_36940 [Rosistilla ulvae]
MLRSLVSLSLLMCGVLQLSADDVKTALHVRTASSQASAVVEAPLPAGLIANVDSNGEMQVQLVDLAAAGRRAAVNLSVSVVGIDGTVRQAIANDGGIATLQVPGEGWYSLVVADANQQKHGVLFVYANVAEAKSAPLVFPIASVSEGEVLRNIRGYLGNPEGPYAPLAGLDAYQISSGSFYQVQLAANGSLSGQVIAPLREDRQGLGSLDSINVTILQGGTAIKRSTANAAGQFTVAGLQPGVYGVIAAGQLGYTAFSFEAVAAPTVSAVQPVSMRTNAAVVGSQLVCCLVPASMLNQTIDAVRNAYESTGGVANAAAGNGATPAGGSSGMGGGGGGGGAGGLGALAGLAAAAAVLASDDDDGVASPAAP